jgi:hypothetical protein
MKKIHSSLLCIAILLQAAILSACNPVDRTPTASPVPTDDIQVYEGYYYSVQRAGGSVSSFVLCEANEEPGPGKGYWLVTNEQFDEMYQAEAKRMMDATIGTLGPGMDAGLYIKFKGIAAPPIDPASGNGYGDQNRYRGQIMVTEALQMKYFIRPYDEDLCQSK